MYILIIVGMCTAAFGFYTDVDDKIDIQGILRDPVLVKAYMDCFMDRGPCTDQMSHYKNHIPDIIANNCEDCSPVQKHMIEEVVKVIVLKYPEEVAAFREKYDPDGDHLLRVMEALDKY